MALLRYVDHTYRDFSRYIEDGGQIVKHKKYDRNFPSKVHQMLSDPKNADAIAWMVSAELNGIVSYIVQMA